MKLPGRRLDLYATSEMEKKKMGIRNVAWKTIKWKFIKKLKKLFKINKINTEQFLKKKFQLY